jgi:UDP-galactopyranose mutase
MGRFARHNRVFFFEEPIFEGDVQILKRSVCVETGVHIVTPVLPIGAESSAPIFLRKLLDSLLAVERIKSFTAWFYTPMALEFSSHLAPVATIYDCMDELSMFKGAPPILCEREQDLFQRADLVFTGGFSLFEAKRDWHPNIHPMPSSVDVPHFARARTEDCSPEDQKGLPRPRLGFAGVIDERMDIDLLRQIAELCPDWQLVMLGPVVKIDPATLPRFTNIHYLGMKSYRELPAYFSGWDVAMLPFALNDSTRFISPTKTPEYMAAGLPVVSTPIHDVVNPYGALNLVEIASDGPQFVQAARRQLESGRTPEARQRAEMFLAKVSWDRTWAAMNDLVSEAIRSRRRPESKWNVARIEKGVAHV